MATVFTARGPVEAEDLGGVLMHEHIFAFHSDMQNDYPWSEETEKLFCDSAVEKLERLHEVGIHSIVDATTIGLGRNVARVAEVARRAKFNVIVATGVYFHRRLPPYFRVEGPEYLEELLVQEITEGIGETGVRAGIIKCVTDQPGLTPDVETALRAASRAHHRTGAPITTHSSPRFETGLIQQEIFRQEGVDLSNVIIGHSGDATDHGYLEKLLDAGSYIGMDMFGLGPAPGMTHEGLSTEEERIATLMAMWNKGYGSRMVLSNDAMCGGDIWADDVPRGMAVRACPDGHRPEPEGSRAERRRRRPDARAEPPVDLRASGRDARPPRRSQRRHSRSVARVTWPLQTGLGPWPSGRRSRSTSVTIGRSTDDESRIAPYAAQAQLQGYISIRATFSPGPPVLGGDATHDERGTEIMRVRVDEQLCTGYGNCKMTAPEVYELDELGFNRTPEKVVPKELEEQARAGAAMCPEQAITIIEDEE